MPIPARAIAPIFPTPASLSLKVADSAVASANAFLVAFRATMVISTKFIRRTSFLLTGTQLLDLHEAEDFYVLPIQLAGQALEPITQTQDRICVYQLGG